MSLDINKIKEQIEHGNTSLGIELGSTRIKAVLIGEDHTPIASGSHDWENRYVDHILDLYPGGYLGPASGTATDKMLRM